MYQAKYERGYEETAVRILWKNIENAAELAVQNTNFRLLSNSYVILNT